MFKIPTEEIKELTSAVNKSFDAVVISEKKIGISLFESLRSRRKTSKF